MIVTGLGQCSLDYIASVDGFPCEDTKMEALDLTVQGGGPVATALVTLRRLGVRTHFIGTISDDRAGLEIKRGLREEGVGVQGLKVKKGGSSQSAFIIVNRKSGSRTIIWQRPTTPLGPKEVPERLIKGSDMLLLDGLMAAPSIRAAGIAKKAGIPVMLDAGRKRPGMMGLAALSDYIVCSEEFADELSTTVKGAIKRLLKSNPKAVTVTLGAKGSVTWESGRYFKTPAFKVRALDTTGAGDVFHGAYLYGVLRGWGLKDTVSFASAAAALKCLKPGGRAGIPSRADVLAFLKR